MRPRQRGDNKASLGRKPAIFGPWLRRNRHPRFPAGNKGTAILSDRQAKQAQYQSLLQASIESILPALTPQQREVVIRRMLIEGSSRGPAHPQRAGEHRDHPRPDDHPAPPR
ncbi:MAG: hypothetical protein EBY35_04980 [Rhodobacteraceae bacterium]|nr:hypothetical protein [Paracoccaceae bacterium]